MVSFGVIVAVGTMTAFLIVWFVERYRIQGQWTVVAARLGMSLRGMSPTQWPRLSGRFGPVAVEVNILTGVGGKGRYTQYEVRHPSAGPAVTLTQQTIVGTALPRMFRGRDVLVGDPSFDDRVVVDAPNTAAVRNFLTPDRRAVVEDVLSVFPKARITNDSMQLAHRGAETDPDTIVETINWLVDLATVFGNADDASEAGGAL